MNFSNTPLVFLGCLATNGLGQQIKQSAMLFWFTCGKWAFVDSTCCILVTIHDSSKMRTIHAVHPQASKKPRLMLKCDCCRTVWMQVLQQALQPRHLPPMSNASCLPFPSHKPTRHEKWASSEHHNWLALLNLRLLAFTTMVHPRPALFANMVRVWPLLWCPMQFLFVFGIVLLLFL